jgi:dienelactone hydrolase
MATHLVEHAVRVTAGAISLEGDLVVPDAPRAIVVFAHGSGSSRKSPRNRRVAAALNGRRLATLLFDLLTEEEDSAESAAGSLRFNVGLLARRLAGATEWLAREPLVSSLPIGLFGSSTGAAAALVAAAERPEIVSAVVSRGGRPDLAGRDLARVKAPALLIVGGADTRVLALNREAFALLTCEKRLDLIPRATHLFEERGALAAVSSLAADWFTSHARRQARRRKQR